MCSFLVQAPSGRFDGFEPASATEYCIGCVAKIASAQHQPEKVQCANQEQVDDPLNVDKYGSS